MSAEAPAPDGIFGLALPFTYGRMQSVPVSVTTPAVAVGFSIPVTGAYALRLVALSFALVSDANAANRILNLDILDADSGVVLRIPPAAVQAASLTNRYSYAVGVQPSTPANTLSQIMPLPPIILQTGWSYSLGIVNVQAGDQVGAVRGIVERFPTGRYGYPVRQVVGADQLPT